MYALGCGRICGCHGKEIKTSTLQENKHMEWNQRPPFTKSLRCFFWLMTVPYHTWTNSKATFARVTVCLKISKEDVVWRRWPNSRPPWKSKQVADARNKILAARHLWDYQGTSVNLLQKRSKLWRHPKTGSERWLTVDLLLAKDFVEGTISWGNLQWMSQILWVTGQHELPLWDIVL